MLPLFPLALLARAASLSVTLPCVVEARERRRGGEEPLGVGGLGGGRALVFNGARSGGMESGCGPPPRLPRGGVGGGFQFRLARVSDRIGEEEGSGTARTDTRFHLGLGQRGLGHAHLGLTNHRLRTVPRARGLA